MRILVVDDDAGILELIPLLLNQLGHRDFVIVNSGRDALEAIASRRVGSEFDCILLDIQMPEMDGIELCERIRRLRSYRKTPIIMLTAMTERPHIDRAFAAGATDYVTKPFDIVELSARLSIAQQLVAARIGRSVVASSPSSEDDEELSVDLSRDVQIDGVSLMVEFEAFQSYLSILSRPSMLSSQIFAVKIVDIDRIGARAKPDELHYALTEVASAISDMLGRYGGLMTYAGGGSFVCISYHSMSVPNESFESEVDSLLDESDTVHDDGSPMDLEVAVGRPIRPNSSATANITQVLDRAIARAEARISEKRKSPDSPNISRVTGG